MPILQKSLKIGILGFNSETVPDRKILGGKSDYGPNWHWDLTIKKYFKMINMLLTRLFGVIISENMIKNKI